MTNTMKHSGIPWIGNIPNHWEVELIGNHIKEVDCPNSANNESNALQFKMGTIIPKKGGDSKYNPETLESYNIVEKGDIIINGLNLSFDFISQRVGLVKEKGVITSAYLAVRPDKAINSEYLTYLFKAYDNCKAFHGMGKGLRQTLAYKEFKTNLIFVPPLTEQKAIADYLDKHCAEVDEMVSLQEKIIEELRAYRQAIITETVTRGLNPNAPMKDSGVEWIGQIPERWDVNKTIRLFETIGSGTTPKFDDIIEERNINWLQSGDINGGYIEKAQNQIPERILNQYSALKIYTSPYIIIAMYGASIGNTAISLIDACVNQACCVLQKSKQIQSYFFYALQSAKSYWNMLSVGGGQPNISQEIIKQTWLPVPPLHEQQEIADYLDKKTAKIDQLIAIKLQKIEELKEYRKSLIYEYVTGKKQPIL